jgi:hypothetical protein
MPDPPAPSPLVRFGGAALGLAAVAYAAAAAMDGRVNFGAMYGGSGIHVDGALAYLAALGAALFGAGAVAISALGPRTPRWIALGALVGSAVFLALWLLATVRALVGPAG